LRQEDDDKAGRAAPRHGLAFTSSRETREGAKLFELWTSRLRGEKRASEASRALALALAVQKRKGASREGGALDSLASPSD
jgi:hypothetical protein